MAKNMGREDENGWICFPNMISEWAMSGKPKEKEMQTTGKMTNKEIGGWGLCVMNINVIKTDMSAVQYRAHICSLTTNYLQLIEEQQIYNPGISIGSNMSVFFVYVSVSALPWEANMAPAVSWKSNSCCRNRMAWGETRREKEHLCLVS